MTPFLVELEQQLRRAAECEVASEHRSPLDLRRRLGSMLRLAPAIAGGGLAVVMLVLGVVLLHHHERPVRSAAPSAVVPVGGALRVGAPVGPSRPFRDAAGQTEPGTAKLVAAVRDPRGGLPWGLEAFRMANGQTCVLAGREQSGRVGLIGEDGLFHDDGRFHPFTPYTVSSYCGQTDGNGHAFIDVSVPAAPVNGNDQRIAHGGCQPPFAHGCRAADERQLGYGLLGPDAMSITYTTHGHTTTVPTGPGGGYIVVGAPVTARHGTGISDHLNPGLITAVHYRNGSSCRPAAIRPDDCPLLGYVAPPHPQVTPAEVQTPVTATVITAKRWCGNNVGHFVACDGKVPAGYHVLPSASGSVLLQWTWIARVSASGPNAGYEYAIKAGPPCGSGQSSSGPIRARRGQRIVQQSLGSSPCAQQDTISVEYRTNVGPGGADFATPPNPGHDGQPLVGSTTIEVPR